MAGTTSGGSITALKLKERDPDYYRKLGSLGGSKKVPKGFAINRELARSAGAKGGQISRRGTGATR
jgi:general stress protein YciG